MFPHFILHGFCHLHLIHFSKKKKKRPDKLVYTPTSAEKKKKETKTLKIFVHDYGQLQP